MVEKEEKFSPTDNLSSLQAEFLMDYKDSIKIENESTRQWENSTPGSNIIQSPTPLGFKVNGWGCQYGTNLKGIRLIINKEVMLGPLNWSIFTNKVDI